MLKFLPLRVRETRVEAEDAVQLTLEVPEPLQASFRGRAGQHIVLRAQIDGEELRRTYSLVSAEDEFPLKIAARVHPAGKLSRYLATRVRAGDVLEAMPPNGSFGPHAPAHPRAAYAAFAAGCGITPVFSIVKTLLEREPSSRVLLFYGNRNGARAMLLSELLALKDRYMDRLALYLLMSREPLDIELLNGRIDAAKVRTFAGTLLPREVAEYFVCGPGNMIEEVTGALRALGVDPSRIHGEHFALGEAPEALSPKGASPAVTRTGATQVTVLMDGRRRSFVMSAPEESLLDAAARAGIDLPFSCKAGVCSTCRTKLVAGEVEMVQNYALEDWELEQGFILACQARARSPRIELSYDES